MREMSYTCPAAFFFDALNTTEHDLNAFNATHLVEVSVKAVMAQSVLSTVCAAATVIISIMLLLFGSKLVKLVGFMSGAALSLIVSGAGMHAIMSEVGVGEEAKCWVSMLVPLACALVGGIFTLLLLDLAFACIGALAGGSAGYGIFVLCLHFASTGVTLYHHDVTFWASLLIGSLIGAVVMVKAKTAILSLATSAAGGVGCAGGLVLLVLQRIDGRFLWFLDPSTRNTHLASPFVFGPTIAAALLAAGGYAFQRHRSRRHPSGYVEYNAKEPLIVP